MDPGSAHIYQAAWDPVPRLTGILNDLLDSEHVVMVHKSQDLDLTKRGDWELQDTTARAPLSSRNQHVRAATSGPD